MPGSIVNHLLLSRYETLLRELYIEPKDEEIMGIFLSVMNEPAIEVEPPRKERSKPKNTVKAKDKNTDICYKFVKNLSISLFKT